MSSKIKIATLHSLLLVIPLVVTLLVLTGCTLYSNSDRQNFNSQAVRQTSTAIATTAVATCAFQLDHPFEKLALLCSSDESDQNSPTTIVRVSR